MLTNTSSNPEARFKNYVGRPDHGCCRYPAKRVLRLRIVAVKNSMKRRLSRSPSTRTIAGSASRLARTNAGGGYYSVGQHNPAMASIPTKRLPAA
jgi:hypothetical protein